MHDEFFDIMKLEEGSLSPRRWIAWALPTTIYGATDGAATNLSASEATEVLSGNPFVAAGNAAPFSVGGLDGKRLDLSTDRPIPVPIFGGRAGDFGLEQDYDLRLGIVKVADDLVFMLVLAPKGELEAAWTVATPILASIEF